MKKLIIIPAYNEEESILGVIQSIRENAPDFDYIVINDCSKDQTKQILSEHEIPHIDLPVNLGIGGAVHTGYIYAMRNGYDYALQADGDGQHDVAYAEKMIAYMIQEHADLCIGSRFIENEGFQSTVLRRTGIRYLTGLIHKVTGKTITDPTSGFRLVNKEVIALFAADYPRDYPEPESNVVLLLNGFKVSEYPVVMKERAGGVSSISPLRAVYYMVKVTLAILLERIRRHEVKQ